MLFAIALIISVVVAYALTKPCKIDLPESAGLRYEPWMPYVSSESVRFRIVYLERLLAAGLGTEALFGQELLSLQKPQLNITVGEASNVLDVAYPFTAEEDEIVNVLTLTERALVKTEEALLGANVSLVERRGGISIYSVVPLPGVPGGPPRPRTAYLAINGQNLIYVEGGSFALESLRRTIDRFQKRNDLLFDSLIIREAYALATKDLPELVAVLGFSQGQNQARVVYDLKAIGHESGQLRVNKVLSFSNTDEMSKNLDSAKALFTDGKDSICQAEAHILASSSRPLNELREQLQSP